MVVAQRLNRESKEDQVLAVVVTFNPDASLLDKSVQALIAQGCRVLVVDNGSSNVDSIKFDASSVEFIRNEANLGLGAAHNQGWKYAKEKGCKYLLIMDQDSVPSEGMVAALIDAYQEQATYNKVSAVGACYINVENQSRSFFVRFGGLKFQRKYIEEGVVEADFLISSGSLFSLEVIDKVGGMDENLFIDHVDTEWFLRARHHGFKAYGVGHALMQHGLGEKTHQFKLGSRKRNVPQHKPFRYYYIFRNSIALYKRGYTSWLWKWNDIQRLAMILLMFGFLKSPRLSNLKMMGLGFWHGLIGKSGKVEF